MPRTAVITQPNYLPWLGYFDQIARADVFVFLDSVQYEKREWQNRNRLKGSNGRPFWLTVPLMSHSQKTRLLEIRISPHQKQWRKEHLRSIETSLGSAPYFRQVFPAVQEWISGEYEYLADLNIAGIKMLSGLLGLSPVFMRASELDAQGYRTALLVNLCRQVGADYYYSSAGAKQYMEDQEYLFEEAGIQVVYQKWEHPVYAQRSKGFVSPLSILDALMNVGTESTRSFIEGRPLTDSARLTS